MDEDLDEVEVSDVDDGSDGSVSLSGSQDSDVDELDKEIDIVDDEDGEESDSKKTKDLGPAFVNQNLEDDYDIEDEGYLQKFDSELNDKYIIDNHPESQINNYNEVIALCKVVRDSTNTIIDVLHKTIPILTKYERTRIIGQRVKQLNIGSKPFIPIGDNIIDNNIIAEIELKEKKIPFIIRRPLPNGTSEYWRLEDLEILI